MRLLLVLFIAWALGTCRSAPPEVPTDFEWTRWTNAAAGYEMVIPDVYRPNVEADGKAVFFRWRRTAPLKVYLTDLESAKHRGLWVGEEPTGEVLLAGLPATRYDYTHCDGPFCSRMASFVLPRGDRWLALEFRSEGDLNAVNQRILDSFTLLPQATGD